MKQSEALQLMHSGQNVFLTGEPGAGKTYTLNKFIDDARGFGKQIAITASTGIAASHIDGVTIHSWSGLGIADKMSEMDMKTLGFKPWIRKKYQAGILIIDEVSMLHGHRLDMVEQMCRIVRGIDAPFGGMQVILVGDLFQLPPVNRDGGEPDFVHQSEAWLKADLKVAYLTEQHRQGADDKLLGILHSMRAGTLTPAQKEMLIERNGQQAESDITRLYTHNVDVDYLNEERLNALDTEERRFSMTSSGDKFKIDAMKRSILAPELLKLKVHAEVMFVANNFDSGYVNGTRGQVVRFSGSGNPVVLTDDGNEVTVLPHTWKTYDEFGQQIVAEVEQYPLRLAWAVTIHKSQGMSLDAAEIDLSRAFAPGMGYVALSRVRSLEGLYLNGLGPQALEMDEDIAEFDKLLREGRTSR